MCLCSNVLNKGTTVNMSKDLLCALCVLCRICVLEILWVSIRLRRMVLQRGYESLGSNLPSFSCIIHPCSPRAGEWGGRGHRRETPHCTPALEEGWRLSVRNNAISALCCLQYLKLFLCTGWSQKLLVLFVSLLDKTVCSVCFTLRPARQSFNYRH